MTSASVDMNAAHLPAQADRHRDDPPLEHKPEHRTSASRVRGYFRFDIEGMRALAVMLVLLGHAGVPLFSGGFIGVDVFFVISGFLITGRILQEIQAKGRLSIRKFYAARVERLVPAASLALFATLLLLLLFLPKARWHNAVLDIFASATYFMNWRLSDRATDYFAAGSAPSPVQHFWSLSVEEQYYLIWPALFLLVLFLARKYLWPSGRAWQVVTAAIGAVFVLSLTWSVILTTVNRPSAYFVTTTRMWELALGSGLALLAGWIPRLRLNHLTSSILAWTGLSAILLAAVGFSESTPFPGFAALLPTLGAVLLLIGGTPSKHPPRVTTWLSLKPMVTIGRHSYSLYLWHWPFLIVISALVDDPNLFLRLLALAASIAAAVLAFRFVEDPVRRLKWIRRSFKNAVIVVVACAFVTSVPALLIAAATNQTVARATAPIHQIRNGATVLAADPKDDPHGAPVDRVDSIVPDPAAAKKDFPDVDRDGCFSNGPEVVPWACEYGSKTAGFRAIMVGDSHAAHWVPAVKAVAETKGWNLKVYGKSACAFVFAAMVHPGTDQVYDGCMQWNRALRDIIMRERPNVVITSNTRFALAEDGKRLIGSANEKARVEAMRNSWASLNSAGIGVIVLLDTPYAPFDVAECASAHREQLTRCSFGRELAMEGVSNDQLEAAAGLPNVRTIDLNYAICPTDMCAAVIGGVLVYRDKDHLTATYSLSLAPRLLAVLDSASAAPRESRS